MPKMKTHRGAAKRFKVTSTGKIRRRRAFMNHMLEKKSPKRKRSLKAPDAVVSGQDAKRIRRLLGK
ncbi:MAG TPA: 50S ribosomal protein L35 [Actinomycetota bacterium]|nr:50S ribosomal protein L35 [Actinomycetota bacterium]